MSINKVIIGKGTLGYYVQTKVTGKNGDNIYNTIEECIQNKDGAKDIAAGLSKIYKVEIENKIFGDEPFKDNNDINIELTERIYLIKKLNSFKVSHIRGKNPYTMPIGELKKLVDWFEKRLNNHS